LDYIQTIPPAKLVLAAGLADFGPGFAELVTCISGADAGILLVEIAHRFHNFTAIFEKISRHLINLCKTNPKCSWA
jgi:hypothetical protein